MEQRDSGKWLQVWVAGEWEWGSDGMEGKKEEGSRGNRRSNGTGRKGLRE